MINSDKIGKTHAISHNGITAIDSGGGEKYQ